MGARTGPKQGGQEAHKSSAQNVTERESQREGQAKNLLVLEVMVLEVPNEVALKTAQDAAISRQ